MYRSDLHPLCMFQGGAPSAATQGICPHGNMLAPHLMLEARNSQTLSEQVAGLMLPAILHACDILCADAARSSEHCQANRAALSRQGLQGHACATMLETSDMHTTSTQQIGVMLAVTLGCENSPLAGAIECWGSGCVAGGSRSSCTRNSIQDSGQIHQLRMVCLFSAWPCMVAQQSLRMFH